MFRAIPVKHYVSRMKEYGFAPDSVLAGSDIKPERLEDPNFMIDIWQSQRVIANMITLTKNEALGFDFGSHVHYPDLGIVGYALISCKSIASAIDLWLKYSHSLVGTLVTVSVEKQQAEWSLTFAEIAPMGRLFEFCVEQNLAGSAKILREMLGVPLELARLEFSYPKPAHYQRYFKEFNCQIIFGADVTRMTIRSPTIDAPLKGYDSEHFQACLTHCDRLLKSISDKQPVAYQIRNLLIAKPGKVPTLKEIASCLHVSPRNLSRLLNHEGVSYQRLVNDYRCDLAKEYVRTSSLSNKEIGYLLGYEETKAFLAAFKNWTGMTMSEFREQPDDVIRN